MKLLWSTILLTLGSFVAGFHDDTRRYLAGRTIQNGIQHAGPQLSSELGSIGIQQGYSGQFKQTAIRRWANQKHREKMQKRMLSQALKKHPSLSSLGYQGKKLTTADVHALKKAGQAIIHQLSTVSSPLVLFIGNSPSYCFETLSAHDIAKYNIHNVAMSGGLPHVTQAQAEQYTTNVLQHVMNQPFKQVVLVDIYTTGASKEEYARFLTTCEDKLKLPKHALKPVQIPIIDATQTKPTSQGVPFLGPPVVIEVPGLARALTDGEYPRLIATFPSSEWHQTPEAVGQRDRLDSLGRLEVIKTIKGV